MELQIQINRPKMTAQASTFSSAPFFDKEEERIYRIITGKVRYAQRPFTVQDLAPDLIIKIKVPHSEFIPRNDYLELANYVAFPSQKLERAAQRAQKSILEEMARKKENNDPSNFRIRLQQALVMRKMAIKTAVLRQQDEQDQGLEMQAIYENNGNLDSFTVEFNAIVYILQQVCGLQVRAFMLYNEEQTEKDIYLFLTVSPQNLLSLAKRYRIKKEIEYSCIDFFLNEPTSKDDRPIRLNSALRIDGAVQKQVKEISRYLEVNHSASSVTQDVIEERELKDEEILNFRDYFEEVEIVFDHYKYKAENNLTNIEKSYIFEYNRRRINRGCEKLFSIFKKRREIFQISKLIAERHNYKVYQEPSSYFEFCLPDKRSKNSSFFDKLGGLLLYKPMIVGERGELDLFLKMERTKLCYLTVKHSFKINFLRKMGFDFLCLPDAFQKFGNERSEVKGGIDGKCLQKAWPMLAVSSDIKTIRGYVGDRVGFEVMMKVIILTYFLWIVIPFALLYVIEEIFGQNTYIYTTAIETILFTISFQAFFYVWQKSEKEYIESFSDSVSSKVFLNSFRGPYRRNILTDEVNEFQNQTGSSSFLINTVCALIMIAIISAMGGIFHGCRQLLLQIHEPLSKYTVNSISLAHIISYILYFLAAQLVFFFATHHVISLMVWLQNPPSDEDERESYVALSFFYLMGLELIPLFFFLILQPFSTTSCYADSCSNELQYYIFSRIILLFITALFRLAHLFLFKYLKAKQFTTKDPPVIYQDRLGSLLSRTVKEANRSTYREDLSQTIILMVGFAINCNTLPIVGALSLLAHFIHLTNSRMEILYERRRPINSSQQIISFSLYLKVIFYVGILFQGWITIFGFQFLQSSFPSVIEILLTKPTVQGVFLFKFTSFCIYILFLIALSKTFYSFFGSFTNSALINRMKNKYIDYMSSKGALKQTYTQPFQPTPLKTLFRTFNPEKLAHQNLEEQLYSSPLNIKEREEEEEMYNADSLINITANAFR